MDETLIPPALSQASHVIDKLGGISSASRILGHSSASTVQGWKERGFVPSFRHREVIEKARAAGIDLRPEDFIEHLRDLAPRARGLRVA